MAFGSLAWNRVLRTLRSYEASVPASSSVIVTTAAAVPVLHEIPALHQLAGLGVLLAGIVLVQARGAAAPRRRPAMDDLRQSADNPGTVR